MSTNGQLSGSGGRRPGIVALPLPDAERCYVVLSLEAHASNLPLLTEWLRDGSPLSLELVHTVRNESGAVARSARVVATGKVLAAGPK
jgi:hypothetical protein